MESLSTYARIVCARGASCTDQFMHMVPHVAGTWQNDEGKQDRLEEGNEIDFEDKDARLFYSG